VIDILVPVLGRPQNAAPLVDSIRRTAKVPVAIVFLCSRGDHEQIDACFDIPDVRGLVMEYPAGPADYARKINTGFHATNSEWIMAAADDLTFEPGWDTVALQRAGDHQHVVATNDMANSQVKRGQFGTHCLIRRRYVTEQGGSANHEPGTVLYEGYDHNYVDRELCHLAQHRGVYVFARHSIVRHRHMLWHTASPDATYRKALKHSRQDQELFFSRAHLWGFAGLSEAERKMAA